MHVHSSTTAAAVQSRSTVQSSSFVLCPNLLPEAAVASHIRTVSSSAMSASSHPASRPYLATLHLQSHHGGAGQDYGTCGTTFDDLTADFGVEPSDGADTDTKLDFLHAQLNCFSRDEVVLERFMLLGPSHRRQGGA